MNKPNISEYSTAEGYYKAMVKYCKVRLTEVVDYFAIKEVEETLEIFQRKLKLLKKN